MKIQVPTPVAMTPGGETMWEAIPHEGKQVLLIDPLLAPETSERVVRVLGGLGAVECPDDLEETHEVLGYGEEGFVYEIEDIAVKIRKREPYKSSNLGEVRAGLAAAKVINNAGLYLKKWEMTLGAVTPLGAILNLGGDLNMMAMAMPVVPGRTLYGLSGMVETQMHDDSIAYEAGNLLHDVLYDSPLYRGFRVDTFRYNFILDKDSGEAPGGSLVKVDTGARPHFNRRFDIVSAAL